MSCTSDNDSSSVIVMKGNQSWCGVIEWLLRNRSGYILTDEVETRFEGFVVDDVVGIDFIRHGKKRSTEKVAGRENPNSIDELFLLSIKGDSLRR